MTDRLEPARRFIPGGLEPMRRVYQGNAPYVVAKGVAMVLPITSVIIGAAMVIAGAAMTSVIIGAAMVTGAAMVVIEGAAKTSVMTGAAAVLP